MPDSGWVTAAVAVNDASRGGDLTWQNPAGAAGGSGAAEAHNQSDEVKDTLLLAAWPPAGIVPQGVDINRIEWDVTIISGLFDAVRDLFIFKDGVLGETDHVAAVEITSGGFFNLRLHWDDSLDGSLIWQLPWVPDDFTGHPNGAGIALRLSVKANRTGYLFTIRFKIHWEGGPPQQEIVGESRIAGLTESFIAGTVATETTAESELEGLVDALVSSFGRWTSPAISFDPLRLAREATIAWDETLPGGTAVACETRLVPAEGEPGPWAEVANGGDLDAVLDAADLAGQTLEVTFLLTTTALPATPRVDNLAVAAAGAYGLSQGFERNPLSGHLNRAAQGVASGESWETFDSYIANPVALSLYDAPEIDIGFDDRARIWAGLDAVVGPGEGGLIQAQRFVATRLDGEEVPAMHELTIEEAELRFARFRARLGGTTGAVLRGFEPTVDLLERTITDTIVVAPGGSTIVFVTPFHTLPGVEVTPEAPGGALRVGGWENRSTTQVTLHVFDSGGTSVGGEATYTITGV